MADTFVARLTPAIPSAIATIAVNGPLAVSAVGEFVAGDRDAEVWLEPGRIRYGRWNAARKTTGAEQVVVCRTGTQEVEIHCHGGNAICQSILVDLELRGCVRCTSHDFPANSNDEICREAETDLQQATTDRAAAILLDQCNGSLGRSIEEAQELARLGKFDAARKVVNQVLQWRELGLHLTKPWRVVLAGPPNVGKSSLVNALVGNQRMIVHHEPGTTRDWVEVHSAIEGWPVSFTDTAGLRDSADFIEGEGIRKAIERVEAADLVVLVVDATIGWTDVHTFLQRKAADKRVLVAWNKFDLFSKFDAPHNAICTSGTQVGGANVLMQAIAHALVPVAPEPLIAIPFRARHIELLQKLAPSM